MSLDDLLNDGRIARQDTSRAEIQELLRLSTRSLQDAGVKGLSSEAKFNLAYEAVLQLAIIPLRASGYRTRDRGHHWSAFHVLPDLIGKDFADMADYFQTCRSKRSTAIYHQASAVGQGEASELLKEAEEFGQQVRRWLKENHSELA